MSGKQSLSRRWRIINTIFILFLVLVLGQDILREVLVSSQETKMIRNELDRDIRIEALNNTELVSDDFNYTIENLRDELVHHSEENTEGVFFATNTFVKLNSGLSTQDMIDGVTEITSEYEKIDNTHNYFIYDIDGNMHYNGITNSFATVNMIAVEDFFQNNYISDFVGGFDVLDANYVSYHDDFQGEIANYLLYGERLEGTELIIANVVNLQVFSAESRGSALVNIEDRYGSSIKNLFILDTDGTILYHTNEEYIGEVIGSTNQVVGDYLTKVSTYATLNESGYIDTEFYNEDNELKNYISYIEVIDEWDLIVGSNVSTDKYQDIIEYYSTANFQLVMQIKIPSYIIIVILSVLIYGFLSSTIKRSQIIVAEDEKLYRKFANFTSEIILIANKQSEIIFCNNLGMKTVFGNRDISTKVSFDQIFVEEEGYYILYGFTEDYFVKYVTESIEYQNQEADLYIISDVTEKIKTERKLEALSLVDELTKLGNRRMMVREYNDTVLPYVKAGNQAYIVMLDLDDFKPANDLYGHSYGDIVLKQVASIFQKSKDKNLFIYRIGGDEFALIFLNNLKEDVFAKLNTLQNEVKNFPFSKDINISFSAGFTAIKINDKHKRFSDYYDKADKLLYKAKKTGKSKIISE